jgi:calcium-dependent protein kinase
VHRDIKPENILFRKKETISDLVISDFGFAVKINDIITNRPRCGTPGYIAPEIISFDQTNNYNELCDVFSCGVVLY